MKKILKTVAVLISVILLFVGCKGMGSESKPNDKRFVSAIGFDGKDGQIVAYVEAVEAVGEGKVNPYILKNRGENVSAILTELEAESVRELSFSHASSLILGESLTKNNIADIFDYFIKSEKIPLSVSVVATEESEELLQFKSDEETASGYEIADMLERMSEELGIGAHSSLYEIKTAMLQTVNIFAIPVLEEDDDSLDFEGMRVYVDNINSAELDYEQSLAYAVLRNIFDGGEIYSKDGVYTVSSAKADIKAEMVSDRLRIDITIKAADDSDILVRIIKRGLEDFDEDIFGISNSVALQYPEIWEKINKDYGKYYKNAEINVSKE